MRKPLAIDLFCGLGGWSHGLIAEGWRCIGYDIERHEYGDERYPGELVIRDVLTIHGSELKDADRSFHVANIHHGNIRSALVTNVDRSSTLMTDDARMYWSIGREFAKHGTVLHAAKEFSRGDGHHSNTAENFFSILKRGVVGTYHHWSEAHMHRYLAEFDFRYSHKDVTDAERSDALLKGIVGKRLTYRRTAALAA